MLLLTVCLLPWIHGGNIPLARLVLQAGAAGAGLLSLVSCVLRRERSGFPPILFPLAALATIGVLQLAPLHAPMVSQMNHAAHATQAAEFSSSSHDSLTMRTASPGDTRIVVAQLVALMLLAMTAYDQLRSRRAVAWSLTAFTINAGVLSVLSFAQLFQQERFLIRDEWWTGMGGPFGPFVNPNNAAGWLVMGLASAIGLLMLQAQDMVVAWRMRLGGRTVRLQDVFETVVRYLAELKATQIAAWLALGMIACAIIATRSRSGMIAVAAAFFVTVLLRMRHRLGMTLLVGAVGVSLVFGLMSVLNLRDGTVRELWTLRNPSGELSDRLVHWKDSLVAVQDFPLLGGGLGAYRYITLPYQTRDSALWFQNADNQYLEVLVEAGGIGLVAFVLLGLPILAGAAGILRRSAAGGYELSAEVVAIVLVFTAVAQAVSALTDYGAVLPSTSALFVTLVSMLAAIQTESKPQAWRSASQPVTAGIRTTLIVAALAFTGDLLRAHECYLVVVATERVTDQPVSWETINERERLLERGTMALQERPDDARAHEAVSRLLRDVTRSQLLKGLPEAEDPEAVAREWPRTSCMVIARRIDELSHTPSDQQYLRSVFRVRTEQSGLIEHCYDALAHLPLPGPVVRRAARWALAAGIADQGRDLGTRARFNEPANAQLGLQLGELAIRTGNDAQAIEIWTQTLQREDAVRGQILAVYDSLNRLEEGLQIFGPKSYVEAVTALAEVVALRQSARSVLKVRLLEIAAGLWSDPTDTPSLDVQIHRSMHLQYDGRVQDRMDWLRKCVVWSPDNVRLHRDLATLLTRSGQTREGLNAWYEVLRIDRFDESAEQAIERIRHQMDTERDRTDLRD